MEADGFTWEGDGGKNMEDEGLGRGFILVRSCIFRFLRKLNVPSEIADGWRDAIDNKVWAEVRSQVTSETTTEDVVEISLEGFIEHTF